MQPLGTAVTHQVYHHLRIRRWDGDRHVAGAGKTADGSTDRGAVSLEQVLWFVAAGVSVAVIAAILWNQIKSAAETPVQSPSSP